MQCILRRVLPHIRENNLDELEIDTVGTHSFELICYTNPHKVFFKQVIDTGQLPSPGQVLMLNTIKPIAEYTLVDVSNIVEVEHLDIFDYPEAVKVIPMNMVGVAGKGLAKYWSINYPQYLDTYRQACFDKQFNSTNLLTFEDCLLVPTKQHWKDKSTSVLVYQTIKGLRTYILNNLENLTHITIPKLGCGVNTGQLDYHQVVKPMLIKELRGLPVKITIEV